MQLLFLPGNNQATVSWVEAIGSEVSERFPDQYIHHYAHWDSGEELLDVNQEAVRLAEEAARYESYAIFAKSAGTWVVLKAVQDGLLVPEHCIFVGTAVNFARVNNIPIDNFLEGYVAPTLFIQQEEDPAMGYADLRQLLLDRGVQNQSVIGIPGNDHQYSNVEQIGAFVLDYNPANKA